MKNLKNKLNKKGGFTLIEMLIVVAIIAILIAVSIPMISNALEKVKVAADEANERSAMATALIKYLSDPPTTDTDYYYAVDGAQGSLKEKNGGTAPTGYGQCEHHVDCYLEVTITTEGEVTMKWAGTNVTSGKEHLYKAPTAP